MKYSFNREGKKLYISHYSDIYNCGSYLDFNHMSINELDRIISLLQEIKREMNENN